MDRFLQDRLSETPDATTRSQTAHLQTTAPAPEKDAQTPSVHVGGVGRARRWEYIPVSVTIFFLSAFCLGMMAQFRVFLAVYVLLGIVMIVENARRLHDVGYSGWWQLIPFYMVLVAFYRGQVGANKYGPDPRKRVGAYEAKAHSRRA